MGTDSHRQIAELSSRKRALLKQILFGSGNSDTSDIHEPKDTSLAKALASLNLAVPIPIVSRQETIPVSLAQQRIWFLDQLEPGGASFNIPVSCRVRGALDVKVLERSFEELIRRHESLRTTFKEVEGNPVQVISADPCLELRAEDLRNLPEGEREGKARELMNEECDRPFDLVRGPLLRVVVIRVGPEEHLLSTVIHHIVSDVWSIEVLSRDVAAFYRAISTGGPSPDLPELPIQYADFACWQRDSVRDDTLDSELSYWKRTLDGLSPQLHLPTDRPRPATFSNQGTSESISLPPILGERLQRLSRQHGVTLFTTLLTAFQTLLQRYTGQDDIAVGTSVAGRNRVETEELIGFFVNTLVLRSNLSGRPTVSELLARVHGVNLDAFEHQKVPFERIVEELRPDRDPSRSPLIQVMFTLDNVPRRAAPGPDNRTTFIKPETRTARSDLSLHIAEFPDGLNVRMEYSTDLFQSSTIVRMLGHFQTLLEGFVTDPERPISNLPLLMPDERRRLLAVSNGAARSYPSHRCLHELFEVQVSKTPNAVAVASPSGQLTYLDLNRRANRLARRLRELGVVPSVLVGLCVDRSIEMVVGLLGVLKAGGCYVPLDPAYPKQRLSFILNDTKSPVLLTQQQILPALPAEAQGVLCLDSEDLDLCGPEDDENTVGGAVPDHLAYVIYTSGSTGNPKGVMIEHRSVVNYVFGFSDHIRQDAPWAYAMVQPLTVDSSVSAIYPPLLSGGCLHVIPREVSLDSTALSEYFAQHPVDVLKIAPVHLSALLDGGHGERLLPRRRLVVGGEVSRRAWAEQLQSLSPQCKIFNHYGPTEATVGITTYELTEQASDGPMLPIGRPLPNTQVFVLDRANQPTPVGVSGELFCGGDCLARGYLNLPDTTRDYFVDGPFGFSSSTRLYRTGDLVRWLPDGNLEFLHRTDQQVKIRGYRVELGEVEAALGSHRDVSDAVVTLQGHDSGSGRLVGYAVPRAGQSLKTAQLRTFLQKKLPRYMVPSLLVVQSDLPRTPHGKVDRRALRAPDQEQLETRPPTIGPRDELEARLTAIWETALGLHPIGPQDNFFDLGGHSLLAVKLFRQIEKVFGRPIPLSSLFEAPTIEAIAAILRSGDQPLRWSSLVPLQPHGSNPPFFCVHANDGNVLFYRDLARHMGLDQPFYGLQSAGLDGTCELLSRVEDMASHYISEIRSVQPEGPYYLGGFCLGAYVALEIAHQLQTEGEEIALLVSLNTDGQWKTIDSFSDGIRLHARNLRRLDLSGKLRYVGGRLAYRVWRARVMIARARLRALQIAKRPRTSNLLAAEVFEVNRRASASYTPSVFRGKLTYFQGSMDALNDPRPLWNRAATDGIDIHVVPGGYIGVLFEPNVEMLADRLKLCLGRADAEER